MNTTEKKIRTKIDEEFLKYAPSEELTDLKEELVADLSEIASDNIEAGKDEDEAIRLAFVHLGSLDELMTEFDEVRKEEQETSEKNIVKIGKFAINDDRITYDDKVIMDEDRIDLGSFLKVEDGSVDMGNGFFRVDDDGVSLGKEKNGNVFSRLKLVNTFRQDISELNDITISYKNDQVEIKQSPNNELIIHEYMSRNNERYYLDSTNVGDGQLYIKQGDRPIMWHIHTKIEIFVPKRYKDKISIINRNGSIVASNVHNSSELAVTASNGSINFENTSVETLNLFCANGAVKISNMVVSDANIVSNNGSISGMKLTGNYTVKTRNGSVKLTMITGSGDFSSNNGAVKIDFENVIGDIETYTKNGTVKIDVPKDSNIEFLLQSKMGTVKNRLDNTKMKFEAQGFVQGTLGDPVYKVVGKSDHGTVKLG